MKLKVSATTVKELVSFTLCVGTKVIGAKSLEDMVAKLKKPRRVMMLVKAGEAVDKFIDALVNYRHIHLLYCFLCDVTWYQKD